MYKKMNWNNSTVLFIRFNYHRGTKCNKCSKMSTFNHTCGYIKEKYGNKYYYSKDDFIQGIKEKIKNGGTTQIKTSSFCPCNGCCYIDNPCNAGLGKYFEHAIKESKKSCGSCKIQLEINSCTVCELDYYTAVVCHIPNKYLDKTDIANTVYIITMFDITPHEHENLAKISFGKNVNWLFQQKTIKFQTSVYSTIDVYDELNKTNAEHILSNLGGMLLCYNPKFNGYAKESEYYQNLIRILTNNKNNIPQPEQKPNPHVNDTKARKKSYIKNT